MTGRDPAVNDRGTGTRKDDAPGKVAAEPRQAVRGGAERLENPNGCLRTIGNGVHTQHPFTINTQNEPVDLIKPRISIEDNREPLKESAVHTAQCGTARAR